MEDLVARIAAVTGLGPDTIRKAIGLILTFLEKEGPAGEVGRLVDAMPGARAAMAAGNEAASGGGMMGMMSGLMGGGMGGGGVMALGARLMQIGVPMDQMKPLARELLAYGREQAGEDTVGAIVASVPGLSQFA